MKYSEELDGFYIQIEVEDWAERNQKQLKHIQNGSLKKETNKNRAVKEKNMFKNYATINMHGVSKIANSHIFEIRIMWIMFLTICGILFAYMTSQSLAKYLQYEVTTKIRTIYQESALFPAGMQIFSEKHSKFF